MNIYQVEYTTKKIDTFTVLITEDYSRAMDMVNRLIKQADILSVGITTWEDGTRIKYAFVL
jgi:hypothetical protein